MTISFHELPDTNAAVISDSVCDHSQQAMDKYWAATFKCCRGFVVAVLLLLLCSARVPAALAQSVSVPKFLNIDCGATEAHVDPLTNFTWVPDNAYIDSAAGKTFVHEYPMTGFPETASLRYFDDLLRLKNCYTLPVTAGSTYLLRVTYFYFNYDAAAEQPPSFDMAIDATVVKHVNNTADDLIFGEYQYVAHSNVTYLCLIRTSPLSTPFISSISLKPATVLSGGRDVKFRDFLQQGNIMTTIARVNYGGTTLIRAPDDFYDRFWFPEGLNTTNYLKPKTSPYEFLATAAPIPNVVVARHPPMAVLQTAVTSNDTIETFLLPRGWNPSNKAATWYMSAFFAELINASGTPTPRNFTVEALGVMSTVSTDGAFLQMYVDDLWPSNVKAGQNSTLTMSAVVDSSSAGPILSCMEVFGVFDSQVPKTVDRDAVAIEDIKRDLNLTEWTGDPCLPVPHSWISCSTHDVTTTQPHIIAVNLSGYQLEGRIPASFANLLELTTLRLENNSLSGPLPEWLTNLAYLNVLSVQNNNFDGPIPEALLLANSHIRFTYQPGNPLLTGVKGNKPPSLAPACDNCNGKSSNAGIIGAGICGALALIFVIVIAALLYCQCRRKASHLLDDEGIDKMKIATSGGAKAYSLAEVKVATTQFNWLLGKGGFGDVYYGKLPDGQEVAVKVADGSSKQGKKEFFNEVDVLSRVHHRNLVALVGYCQEQKPILIQVLIYEYMQNGSLFDHLHGTSANVGKRMLDWRMRLHIALNAAQGLDYLHTGCSPSFIHRDVKSSNILLTPKFDAKVADFGLTKFMGEAKETRVMTDVRGTAGYLDPEYYTTQYLSSKSDVYSFGIVLLELITGRMPIDQAAIATDTNPNIAHWVRESLQNNDIDSVLDSTVKASNPNMEAVWEVAEIAMRSVEPRSVHRPSMADVVQALQGAVATEGISTKSPAFQRQLHSQYSNTSSNSQQRFTSFPRPV